MQQPGDERAGAGEAVEDVDALVGEALAELGAQHLVGGAQDEVDDLDRGVDDAEPVDGALEGGGEELVVELDDDPLLALGVLDALDAAADGGVERVERRLLGGEVVLVEGGEHQLHGAGDGVVRREVVAVEEGLEDGRGDEVLGEHLDRLVAGDALVEVAAQAGEELLELLGGVGLRVLEQAVDAGDVGLGDVGDVLGPGLPVLPLADLLHDAGVHRVAEAVEAVVERELLASRAPSGCSGRSGRGVTSMIRGRSGLRLLSSIWLIIAWKRSSWERSAWRTCHTTL